MFAGLIFGEQEKSPGLKTAALSKIHKCVGSRSAYLEKLLDVECILRVAVGQGIGVPGGAAGRAVGNPCQNGLHFQLRTIRG